MDLLRKKLLYAIFDSQSTWLTARRFSKLLQKYAYSV